MPTLHDFRSDFRRGRTGDGLRINQKAGAYVASLFDADNFMVTSNGKIERRWPTVIRKAVTGETRLEGWTYGSSNAFRFLLAFEAGKLTIYDMDLGAARATFAGEEWDASSMWFMTLTTENNRIVIADATFKTRVLELDVQGGTFTLSDFGFDTLLSDTRLAAPFRSFANKDMTATPTIFTAQGEQAGYGVKIATALNINQADFDLALGTGKLTTSADFFTSEHVGTRMRLGTGEFTVNSVVDARNATITVHSDIAVVLDNDPFFITRNSAIVEVAAENHGLAVGDEVFFYGLSVETDDYADNVLTGAAQYGGATATAAQAYVVQRVVDESHFEIAGNTGVNETTGLYGGSSVRMIPASGLRGISEPAFSDARGWPQAAAFHESRLWLGGTDTLPDAVWASAPFAFRNFDPGDGNPDQAIAMYGIGEQSRVRHLVSGFDLIILCDNGEYYTPGSTDQAIVQETARARAATAHGAAFTAPHNFDGAVFFADKTGGHIRELQLRSSEQGYYAPPASVVVPDWIEQPKHSCAFPGSPEQVTPYLIWGNDNSGALVVMHSSRTDEAFGFMRWTLANGRFVSAAAVGQRLFVSAERGGEFYLLEFETSPAFPKMDFAEQLTGGDGINWSATYLKDGAFQLVSERRVYSDQTLDAGGAFTTPESLTTIEVGDPMPYRAELNAPVSGSGQGPKVGAKQRLVSAKINWNDTETGDVDGVSELGSAGAQSVLTALDNLSFQAPTPVDEWREYFIGAWGREPRLVISGDTPGQVAIRGLVMDVYF